MSEDCNKNHWCIYNSAPGGYSFCPYCGEDITRFKGVEWISEEFDAEDERVINLRRNPPTGESIPIATMRDY